MTISGKLGSGKSTICEIFSRAYGFEIYSTGTIHRELAKKMGLDTLELNKLMRSDSKYDNLIDDEVARLSEERAGEKIIFDSRLAWHFVQHSFKVYTTIDPLLAARRVLATQRGAVEAYRSEQEAKEKLIERANVENVRFKEIYHVDNFDYNNYDLVLDTSWAGAEELAGVLYQAYTEFSPDDGRGVQIQLSPRSIYPTESFDAVSEAAVHGEIRRLEAGERLEPIKIVYLQDYHYVADGHHRLLAALRTKRPFISAELAGPDAPDVRSAPEETLRAYEAAGEFEYVSRP